MATQHPDSASRAFSAKEEVEETILNLSPFEEGGFGCDEQMIDYEGKLTPYHQAAWIVDGIGKRLKMVPGKDYFLTPRVPSERLEGIDRQVMAILSAAIANRHSQPYGGNCANFVIHPMVEKSDELITSHRRLMKIMKFAQEEMGLEKGEVSLIPLFEGVVSLLDIISILEGYVKGMRELGIEQKELRVFLGKSDSAMIYGHGSSILALKIALSRLERYSEKAGIQINPIIGVGKLPFRGHLSPENVLNFAKEYAGYRTVTIQSGLRYDVGVQGVRMVMEGLKEGVNARAKILEEEGLLIQCIRVLSKYYVKTSFPLSDIICKISDITPERRDRVGRTVYPRSFHTCISFIQDEDLLSSSPEAIFLPRAIKFVASLYTMGIPPSIIGIGRGLRGIEEELGEKALDYYLKVYPSLKFDLKFDLQFYDEELMRMYSISPKAMNMIKDDLNEISSIFGLEPERTELGLLHSRLLKEVRRKLTSGQKADAEILEAGRLRGSLG